MEGYIRVQNRESVIHYIYDLGLRFVWGSTCWVTKMSDPVGVVLVGISYGARKASDDELHLFTGR